MPTTKPSTAAGSAGDADAVDAVDAAADEDDADDADADVNDDAEGVDDADTTVPVSSFSLVAMATLKNSPAFFRRSTKFAEGEAAPASDSAFRRSTCSSRQREAGTTVHEKERLCTRGAHEEAKDMRTRPDLRPLVKHRPQFATSSSEKAKVFFDTKSVCAEIIGHDGLQAEMPTA